MGIYSSIKVWTEIMGDSTSFLENISFWWNSVGEVNSTFIAT
jgi:hypothetical protein